MTIFLSATLDAAIWGAELALGEGRERIYLVEPMGKIEDDPDLTDRKFPGNPTKSYRSKFPFRVIGEVATWKGFLMFLLHAPEPSIFIDCYQRYKNCQQIFSADSYNFL